MPWLPTAGCPEWNIILSWRKHNGEGLYPTGNLVFALQWSMWKDWRKGRSLTRRLLCVGFPFGFFFPYPILSSLCFNVLFPVCSVRCYISGGWICYEHHLPTHWKKNKEKTFRLTFHHFEKGSEKSCFLCITTSPLYPLIIIFVSGLIDTTEFTIGVRNRGHYWPKWLLITPHLE